MEERREGRNWGEKGGKRRGQRKYTFVRGGSRNAFASFTSSPTGKSFR